MTKKYFIMLGLLVIGLLAGCVSPPSVSKPPELAGKEKEASVAASIAGQDKPQTLPAGVPVLMYHSVGAEKNNDAVISRERFSEQMAFLHREQYNPITLDELYAYLAEKRPLPSKPIVLTFDDGYRDTYEIVYPILKQYGFRSTLFMIVSEIDQRLTLQELREMKAAGMEIASHSYTHRDLGSLTPQEQADEIAKSKEILDRLLNQNTRHFCFPNGSYNQETLRLLREKGFKTGVTIDPGWVKPGDPVLTLNRVWIGNSVDLAHFEERITRANYSIL
jgi:peptidoglycan/xylan/chitin deacetylase (PgdA/CDA1 family)